MSLWVALSLAAALFQAVRFFLQRYLALDTLSAGGATLARFFYSAPFAALGVGIYLWQVHGAMPALGPAFWAYSVLGGAAQIVATVAIVLLFKARNFAVGITFAKTEVIMAALVGWLLLGDRISLGGAAAMGVGLVGVLLLSVPPDLVRIRWRDLTNRAAALGLGAGALFAVSGVSYRGAALAIDVVDPVARAGLTLACVTILQSLTMMFWLRWREPGQVRAVWAARRIALWVGMLSLGGSFCWFFAFALQNAAYVKAVGQVELIFSALMSVFLLSEHITWREWSGMVLLSVSIVGLLIAL